MISIPSDKNVPVTPLVEKDLPEGYYMYTCFPVYVFRANGAVLARWYDFGSKEEIRRPVSDMDRSAFVSIHL